MNRRADLGAMLRRLGGPDAISRPAFWLALVATETAHFVGNAGITGMALERMGLAAGAVVIMFAWLLVARATFLRDIDVTPRPARMLAAFIIAGAIRGAVIGQGVVALGLSGEREFPSRMIGGILMMVPILVITALVVGTLREGDTRVCELLASRHELEEARQRGQLALSLRNTELIAGIRARLLREADLLDANRPPEALASLQRIAADIVRPLSHELSARTPAMRVRPATVVRASTDWQRALDEALNGRPLRPLLVSGCAFLASLSYSFSVFTPLRVVGTGAAGILLSILLMAPANAMLARLFRGRRLAFRVATFLLVTAGLSGLIGLATVIDTSGTGHALATALGASLLIWCLTALFAVLTSAIRQQRLATAELATTQDVLLWQVARTNQVQWFQQKQVSRALHGPIQAATTAAAMRLDEAIRSGEVEPEMVLALKASILSTFTSLDAIPAESVSMRQAAERLAATWEGLCEVSMAMGPAATTALAGDVIASTILIDILTEATSNAVRHCHADSVHIEIREPSTDLVEIIVQSTGDPIDADGGRGLGVPMIEDCAVAWSVEARSRGCEVRATLPLVARGSVSTVGSDSTSGSVSLHAAPY